MSEYIKVQDRDRDGKLTLGDVEKACVSWLCGDSGVGLARSPPKTGYEMPADR